MLFYATPITELLGFFCVFTVKISFSRKIARHMNNRHMVTVENDFGFDISVTERVEINYKAVN